MFRIKNSDCEIKILSFASPRGFKSNNCNWEVIEKFKSQQIIWRDQVVAWEAYFRNIKSGRVPTINNAKDNLAAMKVLEWLRDVHL